MLNSVQKDMRDTRTCSERHEGPQDMHEKILEAPGHAEEDMRDCCPAGLYFI